MMKNKIFVFVVALLLPALVYAGVTGLPSRPTFQAVKVKQSDATGAQSIFQVQNTHATAAARMTLTSSGHATYCANEADPESAGRRWCWRKTNTAEVYGTNVGSNYDLESFDDDGNHLSFPIQIYRINSAISLNGYTTTIASTSGTPVYGTFSTTGLELTGAFSSTNSCVAGYTRITPNLCMKDSVSAIALTLDACTTIAKPSGADAVLVKTTALLVTSGGAAQRSAQVEAFTGNTCATSAGVRATAAAYEYAGAAGNIGLDTETAIIKGDSTNIYLKLTDDATNGAVGTYSILGYFD